MKLYDCTTAPSPRRVRIFLAEKGISIPMVHVSASGIGECRFSTKLVGIAQSGDGVEVRSSMLMVRRKNSTANIS